MNELSVLQISISTTHAQRQEKSAVILREARSHREHGLLQIIDSVLEKRNNNNNSNSNTTGKTVEFMLEDIDEKFRPRKGGNRKARRKMLMTNEKETKN